MQRLPAEPETRTRGRPRNPAFEEQILGAAARVYGAQGWAAFSLDAVARAAEIGKSTLYARWTSAEALLGAMIEQRWRALALIDNGDLTRDLQAFGCLVLSRYLETGGGVARHLRRDLTTYPALAACIGPVLDQVTAQAIGVLRRARERGQLRAGISLALASDMLLSAMESHAGRIPQGQPLDEPAIADYVRRVVALLTDGIAAS